MSITTSSAATGTSPADSDGRGVSNTTESAKNTAATTTTTTSSSSSSNHTRHAHHDHPTPHAHHHAHHHHAAAHLGGVYVNSNPGMASKCGPVSEEHFIIGDFFVVHPHSDSDPSSSSSSSSSSTTTKDNCRFDEQITLKVSDLMVVAHRLAGWQERGWLVACRRPQKKGCREDGSCAFCVVGNGGSRCKKLGGLGMVLS